MMNNCLINDRFRRTASDSGFSLIELLIVIAIIAIMSVIAVSSLMRSRELYVTEDQALQVIDFFRDATQKAITHREIMSVEIDTNTVGPNGPEIRVVRVNGGGAGNDEILRRQPLLRTAVVNGPPTGVDTVPSPPNYSRAVFSGGIWRSFFLTDGTIVAAQDSVIPINATLFFSTAREGQSTLRAVTLFGGAGATRLWVYRAGGGCPEDSGGKWCKR